MNNKGQQERRVAKDVGERKDKYMFFNVRILNYRHLMMVQYLPGTCTDMLITLPFNIPVS